MPHEVTMPQLGMAQDTGLIVSWTKAPGDPVKTGDVLMEVETDKTTMELEAAHDGYLAEIRAAAGEAVPVGNVVAIISENADDIVVAGNPAVPAESGNNGHTATPEPAATVADVHSTPPPAAASSDSPASAGDRILASAKAKYIAAQRGIDLRQLVRGGTSQPIHVADLQRSTETTPFHTSSSTLVAFFDRQPMEDFVAWTSEIAGRPIEESAVWLNFATRVLRHATAIAPADGILCEYARFGSEERAVFSSDADCVVLSCVRTTDEVGRVADLKILDLSRTRVSDYRPAGSDAAPTVVIGSFSGEKSSVSLHFQEDRMPLETAVALLDDLARHAAEPMKHLL